MSELTPEAVALLEAARQGHGPSDNDRRRVLATLHASLGIGVPIALAPAAAEALSGGQGAVQAATSAAQGGSAALQATGAAAHHAASAVSSAAQGAATSAVAAGHTAKGALGLAAKLLTWKAGKLLLAGVALSSAVGIGVTVAPRRAPDAPAELDAKSGQAAAFATDLRSRSDEPSAAAHADGGKSSSPAPTPTPEREPTAVAAAQAEAAAPTADARGATESVGSAPHSEPALAEPSVVARAAAPAHAKYGSARTHHHRATRTSRAQVRASARAESSAITAPVSADKPAADKPAHDEPAAQPVVAPVPPSVAVEVEAPNELLLIRRAMTSLRDRDANRALTLLEEHAARFPSGSFATERRGLHVVALCAAGRLEDGRREQAAFLKSAGSSPIAARVRGACNERDD